LPDPGVIMDLALQREMDMTAHRQRWDLLSHIYHGRHQELWPEEFREGEQPKNALFVRRSWNMFANLVSKVPDVRSQALSLASRARDRADKIERICLSYNTGWAMPEKADVLSHFLVGLGAAGAGIIPDPSVGGPTLLVEDPRNVLPGPGWDSTSMSAVNPLSWPSDAGGTLEDCIVRKTMTGAQMRKLYARTSPLVNETVPDTSEGMRSHFTVYQYYDSEIAQTVWGGEVLSESEHGCGWCPWYFPTIFAVDAPAGSSMFEQQFGLELAFMRILDQMLAMNDAVSWPWIFTRGHVKVDPRQRLLQGGTPDAMAQMLTPPAHPQMTQNLALLRDLLRQFNMESEASQGTVSGGPITGQGLIQLDRVTIETVRFFFRKLSFLLPRLYASALMIDRNLFGAKEKVISGKGRGGPFFESYKPAKDIGERFGQISVEYGPGLGGYEDFIKLLQALGAEVISEDTIMEQLPWIVSTGEEKRRIWLQNMRKVMLKEGLMGQAGVPLDWLARGMDEISKGADPIKWFADNPANPLPPPAPEQVAPVPPGTPPPAGLPPEQMVAPPALQQLLGVGP
jgi:hypothetical protein